MGGVDGAPECSCAHCMHAQTPILPSCGPHLKCGVPCSSTTRPPLLLVWCCAGVAPPASDTPLAAGLAPRPPRLYWVPACGIPSAVEHYRRATGLAAVPQPPTVDIASVTLAGAGEGRTRAGEAGQQQQEEQQQELQHTLAGGGGGDLAAALAGLMGSADTPTLP